MIINLLKNPKEIEYYSLKILNKQRRKVLKSSFNNTLQINTFLFNF